MRLEIIMALMLISISSASAAVESASAGPYNISFDLNTTMNHTVLSQPTVMLLAPNTTEYSIGIWTDNSSWAGVAVFEQENLTDSTNTSDRTVLGLAMLAAGYMNVTAEDRIIDGKNGMLAAGEMPTGDIIYRAWYWLDSKACECGPVSVGKVKVEVMSLYPQNITDSLLDTMHVEMPANVTENVTENVTAENVTENVTAENATLVNETLVNETLVNETLVNETLVNETLVNETLVNETLANETLVNETLANETLVNETVAENETLAENITALENETLPTETPVTEAPLNETVPENVTVLDNATNASTTSAAEALTNLTSGANATAAENLSTSTAEGLSAPL